MILLSMMCLNDSARAVQFNSLEVTHDGGRYLMSADVYLAAPLPQVYQVITDYNHLTRISSAIRESHVLKQIDAHTYMVFVESHACVLFFCHNIKETQRVIELSPQDVRAEAIPEESNVKTASSSWHLDAQGNGTRMHWQMELDPDFWIPPLIGPLFVKSEMRAQGEYMANGVEKLARERAHLPPLNTDIKRVPGS
jgi:Polyketide cyclase / dehydrase and lipid transport